MGKKKGGVRIKQIGPKAPAVPINPMDALQIPEDEMVQLPPAPDRSYRIFWPLQETFTMDTTGFQVIYPSYLDSTKTIKQGRRIGVEQAVETPSVMDLSQALQSLHIRHVLQPYKGYSRDITCQWDNPGRVLVDVSNHTKKELMMKLAEKLPNLPDRIARVERLKIEQQKEEEKRKEAMAEKEAVAKSNVTSKKKGKKGNKK
jgi:signal recognition particle subunit SRP19